MTDLEIIMFGLKYEKDSDFKRKTEQRIDSMARYHAPHYWKAWKDSECTIEAFKDTELAKKYWKKQHKYYLTTCNRDYD